VRMRRRKPWVLARRRLFGWKVRLLTRRLLAFGTSGFRWNRYSSTCRNSMLGHCCCARDDGLRQRLLSNVGGCGRSVWWTPHRAHPDRDRSPSGRTVNNLDAGTQHRAVGDSTEPRYGALAGAVKPAPPPRWRAAAATITARRRSAGRSWWTIAGPRPPSLAGGPPQPGHDTPKRHARPDKKCAARCGQPLAARPTGLVASPVVGRLPHPSRTRSACPCQGREYS